MKGISTILATIMIVIIVVALVSLTYTFAVGLVSTSTRPVETSVSETTKKIDKSVSIVGDPACSYDAATNKYSITFTIRHLGSTYNISQNEITALLGSSSGKLQWPDTNPLMPSGTATIVYQNDMPVTWSASGSASFIVSAPAADVSKTVSKCS